ncbi:hypothetical protein GOP47_0017960, partial [Adiantum capillus-veneris]
QLVSLPHEETVKLLDAWREHHSLGNKRVVGNSTSSLPYDPIIYDQVFRAPPPKHREHNKLYGREFLKKEDHGQYRVLFANYGMVRGWFAK